MSQVLFHVVLLIGISALSITAGFTNGGDRLSIQPNIPELRIQQTLSESMQLADSVKNIGKHMRNVSPRKYSKNIKNIPSKSVMINQYAISLLDRPKLIRQMLSALDTGHDQLLNSIQPLSLMKLIEYYQHKNPNHKKGIWRDSEKKSVATFICYHFITFHSNNSNESLT